MQDAVAEFSRSAVEAILGENEDKVDVIVVGSGLGGLVSAALLAKTHQYKVLVLEGHHSPGGTTHTFEHSGYLFEMGLQDVGSEIWLGGNSSYAAPKLLNEISAGKLEWISCGTEYHTIVRDKEIFAVREGISTFQADLCAKFPAEKAQIEKYLSEVSKVKKLAVAFMCSRIVPGTTSNGGSTSKNHHGFFSNLFHHHSKSTNSGSQHEALSRADRDAAAEFHKLADLTVEAALRTIVPTNTELRYYLSYLWGKYGLPADAASWVAHCLVAGAYLEGSAYPKGGVGSLAENVIPVIASNGGGKVLVKAKVKSLVIEENVCVGVEVDGYGVIRAKHAVISAIGAANTFDNLLPEREAPKVDIIRKTLQTLQWTTYAYLQVFVGLKGDTEELGLSRSNYWFLPQNPNHTENAVKYFLDETLEVEFPFLHLSFPSAKNPDWSAKHPGKSTCVMFASARYEWFQNLTEQEMKDVSEIVVRRMLKKLLQLFPQLREKIAFAQLATPLAHQAHLGSHRGGVFGLGHSPERFRQEWLRPQSPFRNLYLAGQDVYVCGVANAVISGFMGAAACSPEVYSKYKSLFST